MDGGDCREQELPQCCLLRMLTGWFVRPKSCGQERGWEVLLENCTAPVPVHGFWVNIFSGGSYSVMMGSESITSVVQSEIRPDGFAPVTQLQLLQEERNTGYKSK